MIIYINWFIYISFGIKYLCFSKSGIGLDTPFNFSTINGIFPGYFVDTTLLCFFLSANEYTFLKSGLQYLYVVLDDIFSEINRNCLLI